MNNSKIKNTPKLTNLNEKSKIINKSIMEQKQNLSNNIASLNHIESIYINSLTEQIKQISTLNIKNIYLNKVLQIINNCTRKNGSDTKEKMNNISTSNSVGFPWKNGGGSEKRAIKLKREWMKNSIIKNSKPSLLNNNNSSNKDKIKPSNINHNTNSNDHSLNPLNENSLLLSKNNNEKQQSNKINNNKESIINTTTTTSTTTSTTNVTTNTTTNIKVNNTETDTNANINANTTTLTTTTTTNTTVDNNNNNNNKSSSQDELDLYHIFGNIEINTSKQNDNNIIQNMVKKQLKEWQNVKYQLISQRKQINDTIRKLSEIKSKIEKEMI